MTRQVDGKNNEAKHFVKIDLVSDARKAWQVGYGRQLPPSNVFGANYKNIGMVWTCALSVPNRTEPFYTMTEYPPSVLDECAKALPNGDGFAFTKQTLAKSALPRYSFHPPALSVSRPFPRRSLGVLHSSLFRSSCA